MQRIKLITILYFVLLLSSWFLSFIYEVDGQFLNEIVQLIIAICFINMTIESSSNKDIQSFLMVFIALSFIPALIVELGGVSSNRGNGSTVYIFGHWFGLLTGFFLFKLPKLNLLNTQTIIIIGCLTVSLYININSFQSAHFLWVFICLCLGIGVTKRITLGKILWAVFVITCLYLVQTIDLIWLSTSGRFSWLGMKLLQLFSIITFDISFVSNSPLIRISEVISLVQQSDYFQLLFGRGFASVYLLEGALWDLVVLHEATFPAEQLDLGRLQMVHETSILLLKWTGVVGLLIFIFAIVKKTSAANVDSSDLYFMIAMALLFLLSGVQTGLLTLFLLRFAVGVKT